MKEVIITTIDRPLANVPADACIVGWEDCACIQGAISLPRLMHESLTPIRKEMRALAYELGRTYINGKEVQEHLKAGDTLSMWWCSLLYEGHPKVLPALYPIFKLRALEMLLTRQGAQKLSLYGNDGLLASTLQMLCQKSGLEFTHHELLPDAPKTRATRGLKSFMADLYYRLPAPIKALTRVKLWFLRYKLLFKRIKTSAPKVNRAASIVTYFPNFDAELAKQGRFRSKYWESLHDLLAPKAGEAHRINWLFIPHPSQEISLSKMRDFRDSFMHKGSDGASMSFLEEFISWSDVYKAFLRYTRIAFKSLTIEAALQEKCTLPGSNLKLFPWLAASYADSFRGWRCLERCLQRIAMLNYVKWTGKQEWFMFPMENCPWERMLSEAAHRAGAGPVYGVQHSVIRPTDLRYFDDERTFTTADCAAFQPDKIFCNGRGAQDELLSFGLTPEKVGILEALRYMYLCGVKPQSSAEAPSRLVIVTSFFVDETEKHLALLAKAMPLFSGLRVLLKAHPHLPVESRLAELFPQGGGPELSREPINKLLTPGCMVWASNSTTVALEAAILGLPVMVQAASGDFDLSPAQGLPNVPSIYSIADIEKFLRDPKPAMVTPGYFALDNTMPRWLELLQ